MGRDTKIDGVSPVNDGIALSVSGNAGASSQKDIAIVCIRTRVCDSKSHEAQEQPHCTIGAEATPHNPLAEALGRFTKAYTDVVNMSIADAWYHGLITPQEARRIHEQRQVWQEVTVWM